MTYQPSPPDLVVWLTQVWDEQEASAKACAEVYPSPWEVLDRGWMANVKASEPNFRTVVELEQHDQIDGWLSDRLNHFATHDPASVLARIAADRQILALHSGDNDEACQSHAGNWAYEPCATLRLLAQPYADRPGYQERWAVQ